MFTDRHTEVLITIHCHHSHGQSNILDGKYSERVQISAQAFLSSMLGNTDRQTHIHTNQGR